MKVWETTASSGVRGIRAVEAGRTMFVARLFRALEARNDGMAEIDKYFAAVQKFEASDLHLSTESPPMLRVHGTIMTVDAPPMKANQILKMLQEIIPDDLREEYEETGDVDFAYEFKGVARFRCNAFKDRKGPGGVFRIIPNDFLTAEQLNLPESILKLCELNKGLVLVTGPTGSGKSTTLTAMIDYINKRRREHIITIEDPIEFVHENKKCLINQREVHHHTSSFSKALRAALREDPDIVLVGEMRDLETTHIAIETAETGHLVFGTLHTTTAASTVDRIIDQFPADNQEQIRTMLAGSLSGVIAQTLCKRKAGGRIAALEILIVTSAIGNLIREGKTYQIVSQIQTGGREGMILLNDAMLKLVKDGVIEPEAALAKAIDRKDMTEKLSQLHLDEGEEFEEEEKQEEKEEKPHKKAEATAEEVLETAEVDDDEEQDDEEQQRRAKELEREKEMLKKQMGG